MVWVRLEDRFAEHPKVLALSDRAFRAHVHALCYCGRNETEGFIPTALGTGPGEVAELIGARLWEPATGGYRIHDFLDYNPTKTEIDERRRDRSRAGKKGAEARWRKAGMANDMTSAMAKRCDRDAPSPSPSPSPSPIPIPEKAIARYARSSAGADAGVSMVVRIWNQNRGPLPEIKTVAKDRLRLIGLLAQDSEGDEALLASTVAAFASDPYNRENRYGVETLCRHRSRWLDHGRNGYTPPSNGRHNNLLDDWAPPPEHPGTEHD